MMKKITMMLMAFMMILSGWSVNVKAANTSDTAFSFDNYSNSGGQSAWRDKTNNTKVYVYPKSGPKLKYRVLARNNSMNKGDVASKEYSIPLGTQASITNSVRENGFSQASIKYTRITKAQAYTKGVWSPDSSRNYTIYK